MNSDYEYEIDLLDLLKHVFKKWKVILACALALAVIFTGYAYLKTKVYYRAQVTMVVEAEVSGTPVEKLGIFNRSDVVQAALTESKSTSSVSEASNQISVTRTPYTNKITLIYSSVRNEAVDVLSSLARKSAETINAIPGYSVVANANKVSQLSQVKSGPSIKKYGVLGLFAGAFLYLFVYAIKYIFEDKIRNKDFVEKVLGYSILAELDGSKEGYARLCTNLKYGFRSIKTICICAYEEDGKIVADNLAKSLSGIGKKVLFVKDNIVDEEDALLPILKGTKSMIKSPKDGNLAIIGYKPDDELERTLTSEGFINKIEKVSLDYDYVIVGSPVLGKNISTAILGAECDGVILVAKKDKTSTKAMFEHKKDIDLIHANVLGVVLED